VTAPTTDAAEPTPPPRRSRAVRLALAVVVVGMVAMWGYVVYLAFGPGREDPPDRLDDPTFARAAETRCSEALDRIATLPLAVETATPDARADVLDQANAHLEAMLEDLADLAPAGEEGELVDAWLADWRTYLQDRADYADALRDDPDARLLVTAKGGDQITDYLDAFAQDNRMPACSTPTDAA
jgi:hypothetical protein